MQVFLSYASEDRPVAEEIELALRGAGHGVFFDRASLPPGGEFHVRIKEAVRQCDAFVFLVSPNSVAQGSYARTELKFARERWDHPRERVLPVLVSKVAWEDIPIYLKSVTVLEPEGNTAAEVVDALEAFGESAPAPSPPPVAPPEFTPGAGAPPTAPSSGQVMLGMASHMHNVPVASPQGMAPGMQISVPVTVTGARGHMVQLVVRFTQFGGPFLYANPMERVYRDLAGNVATGTQPRPVTSDSDHYLESTIVIPYFALNFMPTGGMQMYNLAFTVSAYIDQQQVAQTAPVPFQLRY